MSMALLVCLDGGGCQLRKAVNRPVQIVLTDRGAGRAKSVEVIKVVHQEGDIVVLFGHPLHQICYTCEDIWS